ncbi:MAG: biopolymer transporter ExbD [Rhodospirillaceae bacterium]|nr:biopolymer transporter ExbD [Rhodospirillaceae bacterium]
MRTETSLQPRHRPLSTAGRARSLISLTPLIDVVFILVIFFMLASSFVDWRSIEVASRAGAEGGAAGAGALLVEVRAGGVRLSGEPMSLEALSARLADVPERRVLVRPERGVAVQDLVAVLDRISAAGVSDVSLAGSPSSGRAR